MGNRRESPLHSILTTWKSTKETILNHFRVGIIFKFQVLRLTSLHPKDYTRNKKISLKLSKTGIYPPSYEIRHTSKHVPAGDIKHVKATKVPPLPYLPCPIGPCGAFGSSGTSGTSGAFGACSSGAHNASRSQWNGKRRVPELMKSKRQTMKDGGRNPLHSIFMDLWIGMNLGQQ